VYRKGAGLKRVYGEIDQMWVVRVKRVSRRRRIEIKLQYGKMFYCHSGADMCGRVCICYIDCTTVFPITLFSNNVDFRRLKHKLTIIGRQYTRQKMFPTKTIGPLKYSQRIRDVRGKFIRR